MIRNLLSRIGLGWLVPGSSKLDVTLGDSEAQRLRRQLSRGNWQDAHEFLEQTKEPDERDFYLEVICKWDGRPGWLDEWVASKPNSAVPLLVRGTHSIDWAWEARGHGLANTVSGSQFNQFFERLKLADADLKAAAELDKRDPTPWSRLVLAAVGSQLGREEVIARFNKARRCDAFHRTAHSRMIMALTSRWGGSEEALFAFARRASSEAPVGHSLNTLIAEAHLEHRMDLSHDGEETESYFKQPRVQQEVFESAKRTVLSEQHQESRQTLRDRNMLALCFFEMQELKLAQEQFKVLEGRATRFPWIVYENPLAAFHECRRSCR